MPETKAGPPAPKAKRAPTPGHLALERALKQPSTVRRHVGRHRLRAILELHVDPTVDEAMLLQGALGIPVESWSRLRGEDTGEHAAAEEDPASGD